MVKITIEDLVVAGEVVGGRAFDDLLGRFVDEQAEILEYIEELCEDEDLSYVEEGLLVQITLHMWQVFRIRGEIRAPADRKTLLALESACAEKLEMLEKLSRERPQKEEIPGDYLMEIYRDHPQPEAARSAMLLVLTADKDKDQISPAAVVLPVMTIVDYFSGVPLQEKHLLELKDLNPRRWNGIADFRLTEPSLDNTGRMTAGKDFTSLEEANAFMREHCCGKPAKAPPANPRQAAQDIIYQAMDAHNPHVRAHLARKALALFPDCADAYNLLAEEDAETDEKALELYRKGIEAGARALDSEISALQGRMWGDLKGRPYMRARAGEARALRAMGRREETERAYFELLRLNKSDNQGIRYLLLSLYAETMAFDKIHAFINNGEYPEDCAAEWLYTKALAAYALNKPDATSCLKAALSINKYVPDYLLSDKKPPLEGYDGSMRMGGEDEAYYYAMDFKKAWHGTPGAKVWLKTGRDSLSLPKVGRNDPCPCGSGKKFKKCCGR
ncbi:MAG: hypothetical protein A2X28_11525 [Elusimicrobia bacterium GWA2_56_46]|nr:MAG: hypothetical protein A2X28_11525 [Elusimicrobia bacterium GWA2_56_46]OGR54564.1 MAG: hypothetical protein A2X39_10310 [Elusimicrobia bacterium GWC2_56_31]